MPFAPGAVPCRRGSRDSRPPFPSTSSRLTPGRGLPGWGLSACSPRTQRPVPRPYVCPPGQEEKRYDAFLTSLGLARGRRLSRGLPAAAPPQRSSWTSDVEAQATRRTQQTGGPGLGLSDRRSCRPCLGLGGQDQPCRDHPTPFVNLVNCKSNTAVFFTLLVGWIPPGPGLHTAFVPQACVASHPHLPGSSGPGPQGLYKGCNPRAHRLPPQRTGWSGTGR